MARKSKFFANVAAGFVLLFATDFGRADNREPDEHMQLRRLTGIWQANTSEVETAHVRYRSLARVPGKISTRDMVLKLLETTDFVKRPNDARLLSETLGLGIPPKQSAWGYGQLYVSGNKTRVNQDNEGRRSSEEVWTAAAHVIFNRSNDQIDIGLPGQKKNHKKTLGDLRVVPRLEKPAAAKIEQRLAGRLVVRIGTKQFVVDEGTGFVESFREDLTQSSTEIFQKGRVPYPNGIFFPEAVITCHYTRGILKFIAIDVIESATFNEPIKDDAFAIRAPVGSKVFDARVEKGEPGYFTGIDEPISDILSEINKRLAELK